MVGCSVERRNQGLSSDQLRLKFRLLRFQRGWLFEIGPAENALDLSQFETNFPVEKDLLELEELWLFVVPVDARA